MKMSNSRRAAEHTGPGHHTSRLPVLWSLLDVGGKLQCLLNCIVFRFSLLVHVYFWKFGKYRKTQKTLIIIHLVTISWALAIYLVFCKMGQVGTGIIYCLSSHHWTINTINIFTFPSIFKKYPFFTYLRSFLLCICTILYPAFSLTLKVTWAFSHDIIKNVLTRYFFFSDYKSNPYLV